MFNESLYPTPKLIAEQMIAEYKTHELSEMTILDPQAGIGNLLDAVKERLDNHRYRDFSRLYGIEIEPYLVSILQGKGYPVLDRDFLSYQPDINFDLILMNPPFKNFDQHLFHAWNILYHGDIVVLLPTARLTNPLNEGQREAVELIKRRGTVENLGRQFLPRLPMQSFRKDRVNGEYEGDRDDILRETNVEISLVRMKKESDRKFFGFDVEKFEHEAIGKTDVESFTETGVATTNLVANMVLAYDRCFTIYKEVAGKAAEFGYYADILGVDDSAAALLSSHVEKAARCDRHSTGRFINSFLTDLKAKAWESVGSRTKLSALMSQKVHKEFLIMLGQNKSVAFTEDNVNVFLIMLLQNEDAIYTQCLHEAFELMTSNAKGWKTNDDWRVNKRVILHRMIENESMTNRRYRRRCPYVRYDSVREMDDIDRGLAMLSGKRLEDIVKLSEVLEKTPFGEIFESEFFTGRAYLSGTVHLTFKDMALLKRFNEIGSKREAALPDDVKTKGKERKKAGSTQAA